MSYEFRAQALEDLVTAAIYYNSEQPGLGDRFADAVEQALQQIKLFPESAQTIYGDVRRIQVVPFRFGVFYTMTTERIDVLRILHLSRDPATWPE